MKFELYEAVHVLVNCIPRTKYIRGYYGLVVVTPHPPCPQTLYRLRDNLNHLEKSFFFFHILGLNLKNSYQIASLFHMYIDMGERIAGKQDRPSLIIEDPIRAPKITQNIHYFYILAHK